MNTKIIIIMAVFAFCACICIMTHKNTISDLQNQNYELLKEVNVMKKAMIFMQQEIEMFIPTIEYNEIINKNTEKHQIFIVLNKNTIMERNLPIGSYIYCLDANRIYLSIEMSSIDNIEKGLKKGKCIPWYFHSIH